MRSLFLLLTCLFFCACNPNNSKSTDSRITKISNLSNSDSNKPGQLMTDSNSEFEWKIYFKIDEIKSGTVYTNKDKLDVFFRVLVIPEEENIMLIAENISTGEEGGNYRLVKMSRITDDGSVLPKFGLNSVDSLKFIDSVRIQGYFNHKKMIINLDKLKDYATR